MCNQENQDTSKFVTQNIRGDITPLLLSNIMYLIHLGSVTLKFGVKPFMDFSSDVLRNV